MSLPKVQRDQLLSGSWDIFEGAAFSEFTRARHVIEPFNIPRNWRRFRGCDYGYGSYSAVVWVAEHPSGQLIVYRDLEVTGMTAEKLANLILQIEREAGENVSYGMLDWSVFAKRGEQTRSIEQGLRKQNLRWRPADRTPGSRVNGKNLLHFRLQTEDPELEQPLLVFTENCTKCIEQIPALRLDKNNVEDVDMDQRDHIYDALRYVVAANRYRGRAGWTRDDEFFLETNNEARQKLQHNVADPVFGY